MIINNILNFKNKKTMENKIIIHTNIGKVKYLVSFSNGTKQHKDGSEFFDIATFKNKKDLNCFLKFLKANNCQMY